MYRTTIDIHFPDFPDLHTTSFILLPVTLQKRKSRPIRCCLSFFSLVCCAGLGAGFWGNHILHEEVDRFTTATTHVARLVDHAQTQVPALNLFFLICNNFFSSLSFVFLSLLRIFLSFHIRYFRVRAPFMSFSVSHSLSFIIYVLFLISCSVFSSFLALVGYLSTIHLLHVPVLYVRIVYATVAENY
jgi:hypothetical protein